MHYRLLDDGSRLWIRARKSRDIWQNLHEFLLVYDEVEEPAIKYPSSKKVTHLLSHRKLHITVDHAKDINDSNLPSDGFWVPKSSLHKYAFPVPLANVLEELDKK